ncbi:hypothetical protein H257_06988 [Aphanomyces astaci]|uniref:Uncharacterized protein n=1 Tax=Aphanomyces astaci TaxID=112090 RepID=W4GLH5_APHAT|nr:hypothetical protein H257_06988 [Aphanomyces astaci]ETV79758.1 hypothetical protein H257_06988 [Aphanomyces astaci]|eukprot:XP_009830694.1 hypothetical protein H257_06988 [Aphanomyces astaci]
MDVQSMLAQIQENHQASLHALSTQVHALRDTCDLQEKEIQLLRQTFARDNAKAVVERMLLRRQLEEARASASALSETVTLLNHELQTKSMESDDVDQVTTSPQVDPQQQSAPTSPTLRTLPSRNDVSPTHSSASAPSRLSSSHGLPQPRPLTTALPSSNSHYGYEFDGLASHATVTSHSPHRRPNSSSFEPHSSYRIHEHQPLSPMSSPSIGHRRRRRRDSCEHMLSTTTVDTSMDFSYPWTTTSTAASSSKPRPQHPTSQAVLLSSPPHRQQRRDLQVYTMHSVSPSLPSHEEQLPPRRPSTDSTRPKRSSPISSSSRLDQELKNLRAKLQACSRSSGSL